MSTPSSSIPLNTAWQALARTEQLAMVYRLLSGGIAASMGVAILLAAGLKGHLPDQSLVIWLIGAVLVAVLRFLNLRAWRRSSMPTDVRWQWYFYAGATASGLTWGIAGFWLFPSDSAGQMLMTFALGGIAAGGMSTLGVLPGVYTTFLLMSVLPFSLRLFMQPDHNYTLMALMSLVFIAFLVTASRRASTIFTESQRLRLENEDITEKMHALANTAITDPLTGAYNRNMLNVALPSEMERARRHNVPLALILLDIDHFKRVNDNYGHQVGDRTDLAAACVVADRMRREIEQSLFEPAGIITCSFGCSQFWLEDTTDTIIQRADRALYAAKENGRNCVKRA